jgi:hypothetical protein
VLAPHLLSPDQTDFCRVHQPFLTNLTRSRNFGHDRFLMSWTALTKNSLVSLLVRFFIFLVTHNADLQVKVVLISCGRDLDGDLSDFPLVEVLR